MTKTPQQNVPELRFPGFEDEWEESIIGNYFEFKNGLNKEKKYFGKGTPIVNFKDVFNNRTLTVENIKGKVEVSDTEKKLFEVRKGDLFFTRTSEVITEIGIPSVMSEEIKDCVFSGFVLRAREFNENVFAIDFKKYVFTTYQFRKEMIKKSSMTTRALTSGTAIKSMYFKFPTFSEQQKIGTFFSKLDQQIELEERKLELLEQQKKGYMQKIFSQELRFRDEDGNYYPEWESKKLKDIANVYQPQNLSQNNFQKKGYPVYGANGVIGYYKDFNHSNMEIAVACRGNTCGRVNLTEPKSWITSNAMVVNIIDKMEIEFYFLYQYLRIINYSNVISGSGQPQITRKNMNSVELLVPNYIEQQKIGNLFRRFDDFIEKQSDKVELLKERKKGFLQKMFV